jgi:riboflavin biosynthesis pyrimidine reductase
VDRVKPDYTSLELPAAPPDRPYILVNMVMSMDGKAVVEGTEQGIGSKVDQRLMRELRVNADVTINGAETLRASGTSSRVGDPVLEAIRLARGKTPNPIASVISSSGNLPLEKIFFTALDYEAVVYLSEDAPDERRAAIEATGRAVHRVPAKDNFPAVLRHIRQELGAQVLLVEGGPTVNSELFRLDVVDEYFTTIGPVVVGGRETKTPVAGERAFLRKDLRQFDLVWALPNPETNEIYCRYRARR